MVTKSMIPLSSWRKLAVAILFVLLIKLCIFYSSSIEQWYSNGLYPLIARVFRVLFGWLPFSIGDVFYVLLIVGFIVKVWVFFRDIVRRRMTWHLFAGKLVKLMTVLCWLYACFYAFWGLNYYRKGIAFQLKIEKQPYPTGELLQLTETLAVKASGYRKELSEKQFQLGKKELYIKAQQAYDSAQQIFPFLTFKNRSTKASLFGAIGNYLGYTGYYNPFSSEAQINMRTPAIVLPAVVCHEMAHQLGYATEDEANFVGYLAASHSHDKVFLYSIYLDLYQYAASELYMRDSIQYQQARLYLDTLARKDLRDIKLFYLPYRTKMRKIVNAIYGQYLKANNQPQGIDTYSDVVSLLIAYQKKYGKV
ncbi:MULTISPECIES: DUF3810 domain-containing protein [Chitinophagaceae]